MKRLAKQGLRCYRSAFWLIGICLVSLAGCNIAPLDQTALLPGNEYTPGSLASDTATPTAAPSVTPTRAKIVLPSPGVTPELVFTPSSPLNLPSSAPLSPSASSGTQSDPVLSSDLIFLSGDNLLRWDHVTNYTGLLAEHVVSYSISSASKDRRKIALVRSQQITAGGIERFNLDILNLGDMQIDTMLSGIPRPRQVLVSPDGNWVAYVTQADPGQILVVRLDDPETVIEVGTCEQGTEDGCGELSWSPNSDLLLWSDGSGVWATSLNGAPPRQILTNQVEIQDPRGEKMTLAVQLDEWRWSPTGRFVLTCVHPINSPIVWTALLDILTDRLVEIPDTYSSEITASIPFDSPAASVTWLEDGTLLEAHGGSTALRNLPVVKTWKILPTRNDILYPSNSYLLQSGDFPLLPSLAETSINYQLTWLFQTGVDTLSLGIRLPGIQSPPVLFTLSLKDGLLRKIQELPHTTINVLWSPDGSGALILGADGQILFASTHGKDLRDLQAILGSGATSFQWLPPAPRQ